MGTRRSTPGRTAAVPVHGTRRTHATTALLLSFALLFASASLGGSLAHPKRSQARGGFAKQGPGSSRGQAGSRPADDIRVSTPLRLAEKPFRQNPRVQPKRPIAAINQEGASASRSLSAVPATSPPLSPTTSNARTAHAAATSFLVYASGTSRTRGQPGSGC